MSVSSGNFGGIRASGHLGEILLNRGGNIFPMKVLLPNCESLFDAGDKLISDDYKKRVEDQAKGFLEFVNKLK